jgi:hypothetical protein
MVITSAGLLMLLSFVVIARVVFLRDRLGRATWRVPVLLLR